MAIATIPSNKVILLLAVSLVSLSARQCHAGQAVSIRLNDGQEMTAELHPRTSDEHLWLRFGSGHTVILRGVAWERIANATIGDEPVSAAALRQLAAQQIVENESASTPEVLPPSEPTYAEQARELLGFRQRITAVNFDARLANWDRDVESDGIAVRLFPLDSNGQLTRVRGTLHVELIAAKQHKFSDAPSARGMVPSRLGQWSVVVNANEVTEDGVVVKLPFRTIHPEFDTRWATHGLVHVRLVVPGHGVFEHSFDGVRVRAYAPLRDAMELQSGQRFLPTERTGVGKRVQ